MNLIAVCVSLVLILTEHFLHCPINLFENLVCAVAVFFITYLVYTVGGIGAGDVKLLFSLGLLLGGEIKQVFVFSMIAAGIIGAVEVALKKSVVVNSDFGFKVHRIHFAYAILTGLIISIIF